MVVATRKEPSVAVLKFAAIADRSFPLHSFMLSRSCSPRISVKVSTFCFQHSVPFLSLQTFSEKSSTPSSTLFYLTATVNAEFRASYVIPLSEALDEFTHQLVLSVAEVTSAHGAIQCDSCGISKECDERVRVPCRRHQKSHKTFHPADGSVFPVDFLAVSPLQSPY